MAPINHRCIFAGCNCVITYLSFCVLSNAGKMNQGGLLKDGKH